MAGLAPQLNPRSKIVIGLGANYPGIWGTPRSDCVKPWSEMRRARSRLRQGLAALRDGRGRERDAARLCQCRRAARHAALAPGSAPRALQGSSAARRGGAAGPGAGAPSISTLSITAVQVEALAGAPLTACRAAFRLTLPHPDRPSPSPWAPAAPSICARLAASCPQSE